MVRRVLMPSGYKDDHVRRQPMVSSLLPPLRTIAEAICAQPLSGRGQLNFMTDSSHAAADL
jgi:hypothetical protein